MELALSLPCKGVLVTGIFCALLYGRSIAAEPGGNSRIGMESTGRATAEPSNKTGVSENRVKKQSGERSKAEIDSKVQDERGDREEMERRNRLFILVLQILRAPK